MGPESDDAPPKIHRPFLITFSGIDGAGKTTQIEILSSRLQQQGLRVSRFTFWDHVAVWAKLRAEAGYRTIDSGSIAETSFTPKNNKHIRKWYLSAARSGMYFLDVVRLRRLLATGRVRESDVVIFDRYVYDQIANIYSQSIAARIYARALLNQTPVPDLAFILDASPDAAFARKPEYPLEFMHKNRNNFLRLRELLPNLITIPGAAPDDVTSEISFHIRQSRLLEETPHRAKTGVTVDAALVRHQNSRRAQNEPTTTI
jgi:thymidylate kinase